VNRRAHEVNSIRVSLRQKHNAATTEADDRHSTRNFDPVAQLAFVVDDIVDYAALRRTRCRRSDPEMRISVRPCRRIGERRHVVRQIARGRWRQRCHSLWNRTDGSCRHTGFPIGRPTGRLPVSRLR
jgi:hypothetical protein